MNPGKITSCIFIALIVNIFGVIISSEGAIRTLKVGLALRFSDQFNGSVTQLQNGVDAAKGLFEREHPEIKILITRFSHGDDLESVGAAALKAAESGIPAVIGGEMSEEAIALRDQLEPREIVLMTPTSSSPSVTEGHPYAFRACFSDRSVAKKMAEFVFNILKPTAVGVFHNVSSPYTDFLSRQFIEVFTRLNSEKLTKIPLLEEKAIRDTVDFSPFVNKFSENRVSHVIMFTHENDFLRFQLAASQKGLFPVYIGSDGWGSNENVLRKWVKESPSGDKFVAYRNSYWLEESNSPQSEKLRTYYKNVFKRAPTAWDAIAFDASWILFQAMSRVKGKVTGSKVRKALLNAGPQDIVTSHSFRFSLDNSPERDLFIYRIGKNGAKLETVLR